MTPSALLATKIGFSACLLVFALSYIAEASSYLDMGYGGRYGVAHSVGSKLLAVKYATDWNSPGRKRSQPSPSPRRTKTKPRTKLSAFATDDFIRHLFIPSYNRNTDYYATR